MSSERRGSAIVRLRRYPNEPGRSCRGMCIVPDHEIVEMIRSGRLVIRDFSDGSLTPNGYDLRIAEVRMADSGETFHEGTVPIRQGRCSSSAPSSTSSCRTMWRPSCGPGRHGSGRGCWSAWARSMRDSTGRSRSPGSTPPARRSRYRYRVPFRADGAGDDALQLRDDLREEERQLPGTERNNVSTSREEIGPR